MGYHNKDRDDKLKNSKYLRNIILSIDNLRSAMTRVSKRRM